MPNYIHIGAGALGLGLVVPAVNQISTRTIVMNRKYTNNSGRSFDKSEYLRRKKSYKLDILGKIKEVKFDQYLFINEQLPTDFTGDSCIITTSVKDGIFDDKYLYDVSKLIEHISKLHKVVILLSCENRTTSDDFKDKIHPYIERMPENLHFANVIVDRICRIKNYEATEGFYIQVESEKKFTIEKKEIVTEIFGKKFDTLPRNILETEYAKKIIILNLSHALISIWSLKYGYAQLDHYLNQNAEGREFLFHILNELVGVTSFIYPDIDVNDLEKYSFDVSARFLQTPDSVRDIIGRFDGPYGISNFFKDVWSKGVKHFELFDIESYKKFPALLGTLVQIVGLIANDHYIPSD